MEEERALALADLRMMFGETFDKHCHILTMGTYRGEWPVNRMAQGEDAACGDRDEGSLPCRRCGETIWLPDG